jgi:Ras-related C3 botulinum toxin substrate 1
LLVGTKVDLRDDEEYVAELRRSGEDVVTTAMGEELRRSIKAVKYVESSARKKFQIKHLFDEAVRNVLFPRKNDFKKKGECSLL